MQDVQEAWIQSLGQVRKISSGRKWQPTSVFLPGKSYGQMSLVGNSPWGREELDATEHTHVSHLISHM